jgi:hypothetical protein
MLRKDKTPKGFICLTSSSSDNCKIYINTQNIGHFYYKVESGRFSKEIEGRRVTIIGVTTHNNGGFSVLETIEQIIKIIENANK